jgi:Origin recognition complex (ORC) subunit 5 C-terminus
MIAIIIIIFIVFIILVIFIIFIIITIAILYVVKCRGWCSSMPLSEKYLLVAAYLASVNRKETDDSVFAGKQRGKRKKVQAGRDDEVEDVMLARNPASASSRSFTLDRLASIFAQIASTGGVEKLGGGAKAAIALGHRAALSDTGEFTVGQIASSYGDSDFFASVSTTSSLYYSM